MGGFGDGVSVATREIKMVSVEGSSRFCKCVYIYPSGSPGPVQRQKSQEITVNRQQATDESYSLVGRAVQGKKKKKVCEDVAKMANTAPSGAMGILHHKSAINSGT